MEMSNALEVCIAEIVDYMRIKGQFSPVLREVVHRKITAEEARKSGIEVTSEELQKAADTVRIAKGLKKAHDAEEWLKSNGLSLEKWEEYLETNLLIAKFKDTLEKKADKDKFLSSDKIKEGVRELIYEDWLKSTLGND